MDNLFNRDVYLLRVARYLILNASSLKELGLFHGKMGIVIFFAHYGRYVNSKLYNDFSEILLNEIFEEIYQMIDISFESGLCGIGWGIEYLLENNYIEGDSDEILSDIDLRLMECNIRRVNDLSLAQGILGIGCYIEKRLNSSFRIADNKPFDDEFLSDWYLMKKKICILNSLDIIQSICASCDFKNNLLNKTQLGLKGGSAGSALKLILENGK